MVLHNLNISFDDDVLVADGRLLSGSNSIPSAGP